MKEYYTYTLESKIESILHTGMPADRHPRFTTNQYYNSIEAGNGVGVMPHNIDCVLLFKDDGLFKLFNEPLVPRTGLYYIGEGAPQYWHPLGVKPIAKRKIHDRTWTKL